VNSPAGFRRRVLLADSSSPESLLNCSEELGKQGCEVITAGSGFEALQLLRGAKPDLLVTELNLPHMSGFELLSVVRTRFPQIATIAVSGEYTLASLPIETICDGFIAKGPNLCFELGEEVRRLISVSPIRASRARNDAVPVWIPRSNAGYIVLTCPECLRSFSAVEPKTSPASETCLFCSSKVRFQMSAVEQTPAAPPDSVKLRSRKAMDQARKALAQSKSVRKNSD
jgi:CheY-like chemotaxis protein